MVILDLKADNFFLFKDFHINMSYPKKIVNSTIEDENISGRPNFRYKKLVILMGANATGKTSLGLLMMGIFNFIAEKEYIKITPLIEDTSKSAYFSIDLVTRSKELVRIECSVSPKNGEIYSSTDIKVKVKKTDIAPKDNYEICAKRLDEIQMEWVSDYTKALEDVPVLSWLFEYSITTTGSARNYKPRSKDRYTNILRQTLMALDPRIKGIVNVPGADDIYIIKYENKSVVMKNGVLTDDILSSGTKEGIGVATVLAGIKAGGYEFFYCDEKFSHIHSESEKAFLSLLIDCLEPDNQLFFTTHNTDVLEMNLPKHSYAFLRREPDMSISCICASDLLKRNTDSLKNAVENDLFVSLPNVDAIYALKDM